MGRVWVDFQIVIIVSQPDANPVRPGQLPTQPEILNFINYKILDLKSPNLHYE